MKKLILSIFAIATILSTQAQVVIPAADELVLPRFLMSGSTAASRIQYVCRLRLTGLTANTTYRYVTGASTNASLTTSAPGNMYAINNSTSASGYIVGYSSNKSMNGTLFSGNENVSTARYAEFVTDASGNYSGWFAIVPTGNAVFTAGNDLYFYVQINAGGTGTAIHQSYRTTSTIRCLAYGTTSTSTSNDGTAIKGTSIAASETFVLGYDAVGTRPVFGTWVEDDGITTTQTTWYTVSGTGVDGTAGSWGAIIPNYLPNGIVRIESRDINGTVLTYNSSSNGVWGTTNTVNVTGGTTPVAISSTDAPLPVQFKSFNASKANDGALLRWSTATELNNKGFEVQRSVNGGKYQTLGFVKGAGNSSTVQNYTFNDVSTVAGSVCYRLKQVDYNGSFEFSKSACLTLEMAKAAAQVITTPNPFNGELRVAYSSAEDATAQVEIIDMLGKSHYSAAQRVTKGSNDFSINTESLPNGIYFIRITSGTDMTTQRIIKK